MAAPERNVLSYRDLEATILSVNDFQVVAKSKLRKALYEYLASGTGDEQTLAENRSSFHSLYLRPRMMRPVGRLSTTTTLLKQQLSMPVFVSPAGVHALCDPREGECATARACQEAGIMFGLSQHSTRSIEQVAAAAPRANKWFQAYILKDRAVTLGLVERARKAGYQGIFLTVDSVRFGYREADARNGFTSLPAPHRLANYDPVVDTKDTHVNHSFLPGRAPSTTTTKQHDVYNSKQKKAWDQNTEAMFEQNLSWSDVRWLKEEGCQGLPLIIKGIMTAEDAELALEAGADGIMVSNHGGRQLDGALSSFDVLPEIVDAVGGRVPVLLDGGVRRGTDVLKCLAMGATAVGIGKPVFFALAVGGQAGVIHLLNLFKTELEAAMALCGVESIDGISRNLVTRHPSGSDPVPYIRSAL